MSTVEIFDIKLTPRDEKWAESWCRSNTYIIACLTTQFNEIELMKLIRYEIEHYGREGLLHRMVARYSKLRKQREWEMIKQTVRRNNAITDAIRKSSGAVSETGN